ncbi:SOS response-associated peptidase [bacterium]|nr:SOS response-associated peptidase [bacterium]
MKNRFKADFAAAAGSESSTPFTPVHSANGYKHPQLPVITDENPREIQLMGWGLIPSWTKSGEDALKLRRMTLNARSETVFEKPSFRSSIREKRCLVPADGFFEWMNVKGKKYPHFIYLESREIFSMAGIWSEWRDRDRGALLRTYSILTTVANSLVEKIHNTKKRMPVILSREKEGVWLDRGLRDKEIRELMSPFESARMNAHPVSRLITSRREHSNTQSVQQPYEYPEIDSREGL